MASQLTPAVLANPEILSQYPAGVPPPGVIPNYAHPENRGPALVAVGGVMLVLMMGFLMNRLYTKARIVRKFSWDDLTVSLSALGAIALYIMCCWEIQRGPMGKHQYEIHLNDLFDHNFIIPSYLINVVSSPVLWITKFTFFLLYLQIFRPLRWLRISVYVGASLCTAFYFAATVAMFYWATPRRHESWTEEFISDRNARQKTLAVPISSVGLAIDVFLFILPSIAVSNLQMHTMRKLGLMLIFGTGLIAVAASAVSIYYRYQNDHTDDHTWSLLPLLLMTLVEIEVGVMTACLPSCARMLHHHLPPWKSLKSYLSFSRFTTFFSSGIGRSQKSTSDMESQRKELKSPIQHPHQSARSGGGSSTYHYDSNLGPYVNLEKNAAVAGVAGVRTTAETRERERDLELGPMSSVKTFIGGGGTKRVDSEGIYLEHDISQGWSSTDELPKTAGHT